MYDNVINIAVKHKCQWYSKFSFCYFTFCNRVASIRLFE